MHTEDRTEWFVLVACRQRIVTAWRWEGVAWLHGCGITSWERKEKLSATNPILTHAGNRSVSIGWQNTLYTSSLLCAPTRMLPFISVCIAVSICCVFARLTGYIWSKLRASEPLPIIIPASDWSLGLSLMTNHRHRLDIIFVASLHICYSN